MPIKLLPSIYVHPRELLKGEIVAPSGLSITDIAAHMGVSRQALSKLLNGHADLSAEMALRFEKAFGVNADTLMRMQLNHDMAQARSHADDIRVESGWKWRWGHICRRLNGMGRYLLQAQPRTEPTLH